MAIISNTLEAELKDINTHYTLYDKYFETTETQENAVEMVVMAWDCGFVNMKTIKLPKFKVVDFEYIMNKINQEKTYTSFVANFKKLLEKNGYKNGITVYPTSYGIGVFVAFGYRNTISEIKQNIDAILNNNRIEYKNQRSDAGWVFRYLISKKAENIEKLDALI